MLTRAASERLLGFDVRLVDSAWRSAWPEERRARHLLRTDVAQPYSVDPWVWPRAVPAPSRADVAEDGLPLWAALPPLRRALRERAPLDALVVAVTLVSDPAAGPAPPAPETMGLLPLDDAWLLLGYDVADAELLSGLSNCGHAGAEAGALRAAWAPHLNRHHLFGDAGPARDFRDEADRRVPEHAPFFVYGLRRAPA